MTRSSPIVRGPVAALVLGLVFVLPACGLLGGNGDDGDDGKFPEPPDRPGSSRIEMPSSGPGVERTASSEGGFTATVQTPPPTS